MVIILVQGPLMIEGVITAIRETWPLQLVVDAVSGRYDLSLTDDATVDDATLMPDNHSLTVGVRVRINGRLSGSHAIVASQVNVIH
jgi:hypothetical protein